WCSRWRRPRRWRSRCRRCSGSSWRGTTAGFYLRNVRLFVLPLLTGYFVWKRRVGAGTWRWPALAFAGAAVVANVAPFDGDGDTAALLALHLPIALWLAVGVAYTGGRWRDSAARMDFVRFSGELFLYY